MSFLGSLFDPAGALATGGNNNSFDSVFNPADNTFGSNGFDFLPDSVQNFNNTWETPAGNFADDVVSANQDEGRNLWAHARQNPGQLVTGVDPASTSFWNKVSNQNNNPWVDQFGGETKADTQKSADKGINMEDNGYMSTLAHMITSWYGGQALSGLGSTAWGNAGATASEEGLMNGDAAVGTGANAGFQADAQAGTLGSNYGGYLGAGAGTTTPMAGGATAGRVASGAANSGANALDNNQNVFGGVAKGGLQAGLGANLDYASGLGVDNPLYKAGINGAVNGGVRTAMSGDTSNTGYGALVGMLSNLAGQGGQDASNYFSSPSSDGTQGGSTGTTNLGNLAAGLGQLYLSRRNGAGIQGQINNLNSLYAPNSPYAKQMQQSLDRQDAAGGRRSQYGTRAVELQAALANAASRNAPTMASLYGQQRQNRFGQLAGLYTMGRNAGLGGMYNSQQLGPASGGNYSPVQATPSDLQNFDATQNVMDIIPNNTYDQYGG